MSVRVYFKNDGLAPGWSITKVNENAVCFVKAGENVGGPLSVDGGVPYIANYSGQQPPQFDPRLSIFVTRVTIIDRISNSQHMARIDCGEHTVEGASAIVMATSEEYKPAPHIEVSIDGRSVQSAYRLFRNILAGRKAERPYHKKASWPRRCWDRFMNWSTGSDDDDALPDY